MIDFWKDCDWVERAIVFGVLLVVLGVAAGIYARMGEINACKDAGGSWEKDGTYTMIMRKVGDVYVPTKVEGYHCVMPDVVAEEVPPVVEEVPPVSAMDAYLYGDS